MLTTTVAGRTWDYSRAIGRYLGGSDGPGDESFVQPIKLAVGPAGAVYVLNRGMEGTMGGPVMQPRAFGVRIGKFTMGDAHGSEEFVTEFSGFGDGDGEMVWPAGLALDSAGNVYATDEWLNRVVVFAPDGRFLGQWGSGGEAGGEFNRPSGIAIDNDDRVFVVDSMNHRVQVLTTTGESLAVWGTRGDGPGELDSPWGVAVDVEGRVYVADHKNHRVQKFSFDGEILGTFGTFGTGPGELTRPTDVAVDSDGDVYVCDWANDRVQIFSADGDFLASLVGDAQELTKWARQSVDANPDVQKARRRVKTLEPEWRFAMPTGVTFDAEHDRLYVADTQRYRIQVYEKVREYVEPQFNL